MNKQEKIKPLFWLRNQRHETSANDEESIKNSSSMGHYVPPPRYFWWLIFVKAGMSTPSNLALCASPPSSFTQTPSHLTSVPDKDPRAGRLLSFLHQHRQQWQKAPLPLPFLSVLALLPPSRRHRLLCQAPPKAPQNADLGGIDTLPSPFCRMVHDPEKRSQNPPFPPGNSEILADLGKPSPQTPLYSLCSQTATIQLAGFRKKQSNTQ